MEDTNVKTRLLLYLKEKKISQSEFGRTIGVSAAYVASIRRSIDKDKLRLIAEHYPDLNQGWLLYGVGEMINGTQGNALNDDDKAAPTEAALVIALNEISEQRKLTTKSQEQIDRLLGIIESFQKAQ